MSLKNDPNNAHIYGPYLPLSQEEVTQLEDEVFGGRLADYDDYEWTVLQGTHQYMQQSEQLALAGDESESRELSDYATDRFLRLAEIIIRRN